MMRFILFSVLVSITIYSLGFGALWLFTTITEDDDDSDD